MIEGKDMTAIEAPEEDYKETIREFDTEMLALCDAYGIKLRVMSLKHPSFDGTINMLHGTPEEIAPHANSLFDLFSAKFDLGPKT